MCWGCSIQCSIQSKTAIIACKSPHPAASSVPVTQKENQLLAVHQTFHSIMFRLCLVSKMHKFAAHFTSILMSASLKV